MKPSKCTTARNPVQTASRHGYLLMEKSLGEALTGFESAFKAFRAQLDGDPALAGVVFQDVAEWSDLLSYKLVPHLAGEGCLIAAVTGGTNSGKSTVFNLLLGRDVSPVVSTAAATRQPLLAANEMRAKACLDGHLFPEFKAQPLEQSSAVIDRDRPQGGLYIAQAGNLPDRLVLLDTPDVDSIERAHWEVADHIRAAGDVLIAVLTAEKYMDDRVVSFFRQAHETGRVVVPLMNKANPANDYTVARGQLEAFCEAMGYDPELRFVIPHDFTFAEHFTDPIQSLDGRTDLRAYLESLDVPAIKERVYKATVTHFAREAGDFISHAEDVGARLRGVVDDFNHRAGTFASRYDPVPGQAVGGLFHEFVQQKRSPISRWVGSMSKSAVRGAGVVGRTVTRAFRNRTTLDTEALPPSETELRGHHAQEIEHVARDLLTTYLESAHAMREPAAHLVRGAANDLDSEAAIGRVRDETLRGESVSQEFREHASRVLDNWWNDHAGKRRVLIVLDNFLAVMPAAIAAPLSIYTGGVGVPEAVLFAGPVVEQFVARVIEYQFGDAMFDFLSPWKKEQQEQLAAALRHHVAAPCLENVQEFVAVFEGTSMMEMKKWQQACLET